MHKKLTRTGDSLALVLDRSLLDQLGIDADTTLEISTDGRVLVVSPVMDSTRAAKVKAILDDADKRYAVVFETLAQ